MSIAFRRKARQELWESVAWYEEQRPGLGMEFDRAMDALLQHISVSPGRFQHLRPRVGKARLGRFPYHVYFTEVAGGIQVTAIIHNKRGPEWVARRLAE
jgi:toxin ParE1/3/4